MRVRFWLVTIGIMAAITACAPAPPAATPASGGAAIDADVRQVYDSFIKNEMPGVPIELVQAAKREGAVTYYHLVTQVYPRLIAEFNQRIPFVKAQGFQLTGAALVEKFRSEETAGTHIADAWVNTSPAAADELVKLGFVAEYTLTSAGKFPPKWHDPGRWYPSSYVPAVVVWNTKLVPDADAKRVLATWKGIADPYWQGKTLGYLDFPAGGAPQTTMFVLLKEYGLPFWEAMAKQKFNLYNSGAPITEAVASGEIAMGISVIESLAYPRWKAGAPIHYTYASPVIVVTNAHLVSKNAPHPNAAKLLHEFVFSRLGQQIIVNEGERSFRDDVKDEREVTKEPWYSPPAKPYEIDRAEIVAGLAQMGKDYDRIFKKK